MIARLSKRDLGSLSHGDELRVVIGGQRTGGLYVGLKPGSPGIILVRLLSDVPASRKEEFDVEKDRVERVHPPPSE